MGLKLALIALLVAGLTASGLWVKGRIDLSYEQAAIIERQAQTIKDQQAAAARKAATDEANRIASEKANEQIRAAEERAIARTEVFHRRGEGRFERLLQERPGLVMSRVNRATDRVFGDLECAARARGSGACGVPAGEQSARTETEAGAVRGPS